MSIHKFYYKINKSVMRIRLKRALKIYWLLHSLNEMSMLALVLISEALTFRLECRINSTVSKQKLRKHFFFK